MAAALAACGEGAPRGMGAQGVDASVDGALDAVDAGAPDGGAPDGGAPDVAAREGCNPLATSSECLLPYPSDFLTRPDPTARTGRRLALPEGAVVVPAAARAIELAPFNRADGAPTSAPILVHLGVDVAPESLAPAGQTERSLDAASPIALFDMSTGRRVPFLSEMDQNRRDQRERAALILRPLAPLAFGTRHVVAIRATLRTRGDAAPLASPGFLSLRDGTPTGDPRVDGARARYEEIFNFLAARGYARPGLSLAWDFTTASREHVLGPILAMRREVFARADGPGIPFTIERVDEDPNANVARIVRGTFAPPNYLRDDQTIDFAPDGAPRVQPQERRYPFTMIVPRRARREAAALPLVLFGHGVFGNGRDYLTGSIGTRTIQPLAEEAGAVIVATDWIGLSSGDTELIIREVVPNINRLGLVTDRLLQSLVNNLALLELSLGGLARDPRVRVGAGELVDRARVYYYGVSLGGIQGASLVSASRHVTRAVVAVPGASWSNILPRSSVYAPIKTFVDRLYPDPLTQQVFLALMQGRFDPTDGVNVGTLLRDPPADAPAGRRVLIQEAIGDCQVPNLSTDILARTFGARLLSPAVERVPLLEAVESPAEVTVLAQYALVRDLARYTPPAENVVPTMDNGVHSGMVFLPQVSRQLRDFFATGRVVQHCMGPCDPD